MFRPNRFVTLALEIVYGTDVAGQVFFCARHSLSAKRMHDTQDKAHYC